MQSVNKNKGTGGYCQKLVDTIKHKLMQKHKNKYHSSFFQKLLCFMNCELQSLINSWTSFEIILVDSELFEIVFLDFL